MNLFKSLGTNISYKDWIQLDGAFALTHINYNKSPEFNGVDGRDLAKVSRKNSVSSKEKIEDVLGNLSSFKGVEKYYNKGDKEQLWKLYWLEYINAFDGLTDVLPNSIVTIYVGRQAIELGLKYLLLLVDNCPNNTHNIGELAKSLLEKYNVTEQYDFLQGVDVFCEKYCDYIEGGYAEYFRFPEYKGQSFFAGNRLDIGCISYNFAIVLLKLLYLAGLDNDE